MCKGISWAQNKHSTNGSGQHEAATEVDIKGSPSFCPHEGEKSQMQPSEGPSFTELHLVHSVDFKG